MVERGQRLVFESGKMPDEEFVVKVIYFLDPNNQYDLLRFGYRNPGENGYQQVLPDGLELIRG